MNIKLNNESVSIPDGMDILKLLAWGGYRQNTAIWVNGRQLLIKEYDQHSINDGDEVILIRILGGG